jgi:lysyl-tRNA synthetase, class II
MSRNFTKLPWDARLAEHSDELRAQRIAKLKRLRARGVDPYPARLKRDSDLQTAAERLRRWEEGGSAGEAPRVAVAGRLVALRLMGKAAFGDLRDASGRLQIHLREDRLGERYERLHDLDLGDFLAVEGPLFRTRTGEITVAAESLTPIGKALRPLPEKWHGIQDVELRHRQRYLDLIASEEVRSLFQSRGRALSAIRRFMDGRGFVEVETPVLQASAGGAAARPFITHVNAIDEDRPLRIATELYLKRLIVGGMDRVYEIGRIFRNEGLSTRHNPEFTMMESYEAYADYRAVAAMLESLVSSAAEEVLGTTTVSRGTVELQLAPPWRRTTFSEELRSHAGFDLLDYLDLDRLRAKMREIGVEAPAAAGWGKCIDEVFSTLVEPTLVQPTIVFDYPVALSPLAKSKDGEPQIVERFEAFIGGFEIANAYSELNDPIEQRLRFELQAQERAAGDQETEPYDEDFLLALEHGMPPTGGLGLGIDRLVMILTNQTSIREVILFPLLRSLNPRGEA